MNKTVCKFLEIIVKNKLPNEHIIALQEKIIKLYENTSEYALEFYENFLDNEEDLSENEKIERTLFYKKSSLMIAELTFNDFEYSPIHYAEDSISMHESLQSEFENLEDYPEGENFDSVEYAHFLKNTMQRTTPNYIIFEFFDYLPTEEESFVLFAIKTNSVKEMELLAKVMEVNCAPFYEI